MTSNEIFPLLEQAENRGLQISHQIGREQRATLGQFLTPAPIARLLAEPFQNISGEIHLLDPGAGLGVLTAAFVEKIIQNSDAVTSCHLTAYEIEPLFISGLEQTLDECCKTLKREGVSANYSLLKEDFLVSGSVNLSSPLFNIGYQTFTHSILNPPYKKINSHSLVKKEILKIGIDTVNLYTAFVWLAMMRLNRGGEISAITPRSFCNGAYYLPFRKAFLREMALDNIHVFESRSAVFSHDDVLQENIIFHAIKQQKKLESVTISSRSGYDLDDQPKIKVTPYSSVVKPGDRDLFIHISTDRIEDTLRNQMEAFPSRLCDLGLEVSTGPIVDFRMRDVLQSYCDDSSVPIIYPESLRNGQVSWPPANPRKPIAIKGNLENKKWLTNSGWYVLTKRFSAKEEKRRVVAGICSPLDNFRLFGIENHLNFYHVNGEGLDEFLAKGLSAFLNSTLFDNYFRQFSGHTQVNATDLRMIRYPHRDDLIRLGKFVGDTIPSQKELDNLIMEVLPLMSETKLAFQASSRINEALAILQEISVPREQQNERSALCLLALGDIKPETKWEDAQQPLRGITEMMDWFRDEYGKVYAPNTRETVRRQTMHQFVQLGLVLENPDKPDRPINSPKWCYQLTKDGLNMLRAYGSYNWEQAKQEYGIATTNILRERHRNLLTIPVTLWDNRTVELSAGGQNELIRDIINKFCPRYTPGGIVLYIGDAGDKFIIQETAIFMEMGIELDPHGKMPDLVVFYKERDWLILIEAVTSHGPVNLKRHNELKHLFRNSLKGLVFVTAFPSRREMAKYLGEISWETEVWIARQPDHLIHFNGEKFLGPYDNE